MQLGVAGNGETSHVGTARSCQWDTGVAILEADIRTNAGLGQVQTNGGAVRDAMIGGRQAKRQQNSVACLYALGVTSSSRVDVSASNNNGPDCQLAQQAAQLIERNLPRS